MYEWSATDESRHCIVRPLRVVICQSHLEALHSLAVSICAFDDFISVCDTVDAGKKTKKNTTRTEKVHTIR